MGTATASRSTRTLDRETAAKGGKCKPKEKGLYYASNEEEHNVDARQHPATANQKNNLLRMSGGLAPYAR
jgi:hypothetical protein